MDAPPVPTIKGVFVNSHVEAVRKAKGEDGVRALEDAFGAPLRFRMTDDVPVRDEVRLIELALDVVTDRAFDGERRAYEAGRMHFRDFATTPWARMVFSVFPMNYRYMMLHASGIAEMVFRGVTFRSEAVGPKAVRVVMENADYPVEHFRGLFHEWMERFGHEGEVAAEVTAPGRYEYLLTWT